MASDKRENTRCLGSLLIGGYSVSTVTIYMVQFFYYTNKKNQPRLK